MDRLEVSAYAPGARKGNRAEHRKGNHGTARKAQQDEPRANAQRWPQCVRETGRIGARYLGGAASGRFAVR